MTLQNIPFVFELLMILATVMAFWGARTLYLRAKMSPLLQPVLVGSGLMIVALLATGVSYDDYFESVQLIHWFLAPSIVGLAVPLFYEARAMKNKLKHIFVIVCFGGVLTVAFAIAILWFSDASDASIRSMLTKSVTTAVAVLVAEETGAIASLAAGFVMLTGVFGAIVGPYVFRKMQVEDDEQKGLALGLSAHAIGTVKAFEISSKCGAYSILAMIINGIFTAILLPLCFWLF